MLSVASAESIFHAQVYLLDMATVVLPGVSDDAIGGLQHLIETYFHDGLTFAEMCLFLERRHGVPLTVHQLKRRLRFFGLKRRGVTVSLREVEDAIRVSLVINH